MAIDLQPAHCKLFSLHSHFTHGEPPRELLAKACGSQFLKRSGKAEGRYSVSGREYGVRATVSRSATFGTVVNIDYENLPERSGKRKPHLDVEKLWECLEKATEHPTWHCRGLFEYPQSGYSLRYELPSPIDRPLDGFNEVRGVRLVRTVETKPLYSVILDRPGNEETTCSLFFTMLKPKLVGLADEAFSKALEIVGFAIAAESKDGR